MVIKQVGALSCARIAGTLYAILGLFAGAIFSLIAIVGGIGNQAAEGAMFGAFLGAGAIIIVPIMYGCLGFVTTLIMAWLYNVLAGIMGGVEIDVQ
jgi:hypothetical protein